MNGGKTNGRKDERGDRLASLSALRRQDGTQVRPHTVLEDFPLFCPKCRYTCVIRFQNGIMEEIKMPDA